MLLACWGEAEIWGRLCGRCTGRCAVAAPAETSIWCPLYTQTAALRKVLPSTPPEPEADAMDVDAEDLHEAGHLGPVPDIEKELKSRAGRKHLP